jgi:iron complex outermembrane recepter protein
VAGSLDSVAKEKKGVLMNPGKVWAQRAILIFALACPCAAAQSVGDASPGQATSDKVAEPTDISEVVVTAQKRSQSINDVGLTVSAITSDALAKQGISTLADVAQAVPSLSFSESANHTPILTLRGVGFIEGSLPSYPAVSVSMDEVPLAFPALTTLAAYDLERIEVLKGPQGTLFGQNTTGGAINYIAAKPTSQFAEGSDLSYGSFKRVEFNGYVSGPLSDTLRGRLAVRVTRADDWQHSYTRDDTVGKAATYAMRLLLGWVPTETLTFSLNLNGWLDKSDPVVPQFVVASPSLPKFELPALLTYPSAPENPRDGNWSPEHRPFTNNRFYQSSLRTDWQAVPGLTVTSLTSYGDFTEDALTAEDGTPFVIEDVPQRGFIKSFYEELRVANDASGRVRALAGVNYSHDRVFDEIIAYYKDQSNARFLNSDYNDSNTLQTMDNYAGFANVEFDVVPRLTLKAGARYTEADRTAYNCVYDAGNGNVDAYFAGLSVRLRQAFGQDPRYVPITGSQCYTLDAVTHLPTLTPFRSVLNEHNVSWRGGLDYRVTDDLLLYTNVSKGYKAGSIPRVGASSTVAYAPVTEESVLAYEAGFKLMALDRKLSLNGAAYYYDYKNKQLRTKIIDPVFHLLEALSNVPRSDIRGGELEAALWPVTGLAIRLAGTFTDAKIRQYTGPNIAGTLVNFAGTQMPLSPEWQGFASADYEWVMGRVKPFVGATYTLRSSTFAIIGGERQLINGEQAFKINSYSTLDLRAGVAAADGRWRAQVFGKNVLNKYYWDNVFTIETIVRYPAMPATYGVSVEYRLR